jgi:ABC-type multidrug transport system ATPase subunit
MAIPRLTFGSLGMTIGVDCHRMSAPPDPIAPRLRVEQLHKRFGQVVALSDATFRIEPSEVLGLLGPNGAGKSTLLACLAGLVAADGGRVLGDHGAEVAVAKRHEQLIYLPDAVRPWSDQTVSWVTDFWRALVNADNSAWPTILATLDIDNLGGQRMGELSKGQRKRVLLAMTLVSPRPIVMMDEPFDGLDLRQTRSTIAMFREIAAAGRSLVISIHSMSAAARVCDRLVLLSDGRTVAEGTPAELRMLANLPDDAELEDVFLTLA